MHRLLIEGVETTCLCCNCELTSSPAAAVILDIDNTEYISSIGTRWQQLHQTSNVCSSYSAALAMHIHGADTDVHDQGHSIGRGRLAIHLHLATNPPAMGYSQSSINPIIIIIIIIIIILNAEHASDDPAWSSKYFGGASAICLDLHLTLSVHVMASAF